MRSAIFVYLLIIIYGCSGAYETFTVEKRELNEAVYASGQVMPHEYYFLQVNVPDRLMRILVEEGHFVEKGSFVAILGTPSEGLQIDILTQQVALARQQAGEQSAVLQELSSRAEIAKAKYKQDSINASKYSQLVAERAVSVREAEQASLQAETSKAEYVSIRQQYKSKKNELQQNVLKAEHQLAQLQQSREGKILESPMKGRVFKVFQEEGTLVQPGEPVVLIGNPDKYKLELLVDERDIYRIKMGQRIYFQTDLYPEIQFEARINKIIPVLQKDTRSFEVEAGEVSSDSILYPQSSVEANIMIRENANVLAIPANYILKGDSIWKEVGEKLEKISVDIGIRDEEWIEITGGLKEGDIIARYK